MTQYVVTDTELEAVADAIRLKGGTSADLEWTSGYIAAIRAISGGGGGSTSDPAELFDIMADCYALNSSAGYNILSSMYVSHAVGDRMEINGRYFQRDTAIPALIVNQTSSVVGTRGYVIYSPSQDAFSGTYSEYGDIWGLTALTSPAGNTFYRMRMASSWVTSQTFPVTISNGGNTIASLAANGFLLNYDLDDSAMVSLIGSIMDALFFGQAGGGVNILSGEDAPTAELGDNGAIYLKYGLELYSIQDLVSHEGALSVAVSANSYWPGYQPWKAFTTESNTGWIGNGGNPHWLQVVTQTDVTIKTISFYSNDSSRAHAISRVGYSEDGTTFTDAPLSSSTMVNRNGKAVLSQGATGKYFRFYFDGSYNSSTYPMMEKVKIMAEGQRLIVDAAYVKVGGAWQPLIGTDINDINLGGGSSDAPVSTIAVVNGSVVSDGVTITAQPVISNGQMTASSSAGLEFKLNPVMDVEIECDFTPAQDAILLSFGGSNTNTGILAVKSYQFEFYGNGLDLVDPISVSVGVQYHLKIEISQSTCKLYVDGTLAATLTHNIFATIAAYIANKNSIALLWNQSWHGEYTTSLVNNLSIKLVSYITA